MIAENILTKKEEKSGSRPWSLTRTDLRLTTTTQMARKYISHIKRSCNALIRGSSTTRSGPKILGRVNCVSALTSSVNGGCEVDSLPSPKGSTNGAIILDRCSEAGVAKGAIIAISSWVGLATSLMLLVLDSSRLLSSEDRREWVLRECCPGMDVIEI